jgi:SEC-C motif
MTDPSSGLGRRLDVDLAIRWRSADGQIARFLRLVGVTGEEHSQALYIFPKPSADVRQTIDELCIATANDKGWLYQTGEWGGKPFVIAWPVADHTALTARNPKKITLALYVEIHSRLVSWWLTNAWRSEQLARAAWQLADSEQIVPAAACARSLVETAAAFWVDTRKLSELWQSVKVRTAEHGPDLMHWHELRMQIWRMMWGRKFDDKVPDWAKRSELLPRTNVLGLIEKLQRATSDLLQRDYQWLCNVVHPSIGNMLAFAAPMLCHITETNAFQYVAPFGTAIIERNGRRHYENTVEEALARSAVLAVAVLHETLDVALRIVDDIALTTGAPTMASFKYWRMVSQKSRNAPCPCRSGKKAKNCPHAWTQQGPQVPERFSVGSTV